MPGDNSELVVIPLAQLKQIIAEAVGANGAGGEEKWFFSAEEASRLIGIPKSWLESAAKRGEIKRIQFGHYKVFAREELQRFAEDYKKRSGI
jgi:hypothetical protein